MNILIKDSLPFITGMGFRKKCDFYVDEFEISDFKTSFDGMKIFVKTDYIDFFFENISKNIHNNYFLYTHNSDICIGEYHLKYINATNLIKWFAQNMNVFHEKIIPIPIGLANARWKHGDVNIMKKIQNENNKKTDLFYLNINPNTNSIDRLSCIKEVNLKNESAVDYETYLRKISKSYFVISPLGNGIDTHRNWEAMYLNSVPITIQKPFNQFFKKQGLPFHLLNDWSEFDKNVFNLNYYEKLISFDRNLLELA